MFRGDSEFHEDAAPSHLGGAVRMQPASEPVPLPVETLPTANVRVDGPVAVAAPSLSPGGCAWDDGAEKELKKIPFFVRGKARRNTERYASERGLSVITTETLYDAKAYFTR
jgi:light-independent protochlorophyllide reductase subunit B